MTAYCVIPAINHLGQNCVVPRKRPYRHDGYALYYRAIRRTPALKHQGRRPADARLDTVAGARRNRSGTMTVTHVTEQALRQLNSPDALAHCELVALLPRTLAAIRANAGQPATRK